MSHFIQSACLAVWIGSLPMLAVQQPPTIEDSLTSRGILLSVPSLRQALLFNADPEVRSLAAVELAHKKDTPSIPLIQDRLRKATVLNEKRSLSVALLAFDDPMGHSGMLNICKDAGIREDDRITAAQQLDIAGDSACFGPLVELLSTGTAFGTRQAVLAFLKEHSAAKPPSLESLQKGLERSLQDESPATREDASECIVIFKVIDAIRSLRKAVNRETNPAVRGKLRQNLDKLQALHPAR